MKTRSRARELALELLYQIDLVGEEVLERMDETLDLAGAPAETREYTEALVRGVHARRPEIDRYLEAVAQNWEIERMATIDRNVLRISTFELLAREDVPTKVSINEAIELGKRYSTQASGSFINGVLDKLKDRLRRKDNL